MKTPRNKVSLVVPEWMFSVLPESRIREMAQEVITSCKLAGMTKTQAVECALLTLEGACE